MHYLPAEALHCWYEVCLVDAGSALLLQSPPCCHGLRPVAEFLYCCRLPWQWHAASAMGMYLSRGRCPSPTELHHPGFSCAHSETLHLERLESPFCLSHCTGTSAIYLESSGLTHCSSSIQSDGYANLPS